MLKFRPLDSEKLYPLDKVTISKKEKTESYFILESSAEKNISLSVRVPLKIRDKFTTQQFECLAFNSPTLHKEQDIFQISVNDSKVGRIGWIFPIQSLASNKHSFADNEYFLNYAYIAYFKLLLGEVLIEDQVIETMSFEQELSIDDIYDSQLVIMTLSNEKTKLIADFSIDDFLPALYLHNYFYYTGTEAFAKVGQNDDDIPLVKINLAPVSSDLKSEIYLKSLFKTHLIQNNHPLVQFHLLYQIVELLINRVYDCEIRRILKATIDRVKTPHEMLDETNEIASENWRIKRLVEQYIPKKKYPPNSLTDASNDLLQFFNNRKDSLADAFYQVRNTVVHNYRTVAKIDPNLTVLSNINTEFVRFLVDVLENYVEPENSFEFHNMPTAWLLYQLQIEARTSSS